MAEHHSDLTKTASDWMISSNFYFRIVKSLYYGTKWTNQSGNFCILTKYNQRKNAFNSRIFLSMYTIENKHCKTASPVTEMLKIQKNLIIIKYKILLFQGEIFRRKFLIFYQKHMSE